MNNNTKWIARQDWFFKYALSVFFIGTFSLAFAIIVVSIVLVGVLMGIYGPSVIHDVLQILHNFANK